MVDRSFLRRNSRLLQLIRTEWGKEMEALKAVGAFVLGAIAFVFGSAIYVFFFGIMILSFPLSVIALMHLWSFEWWSALILAVSMNFVPLGGQIAHVVFAIMGAVFFYQADFNWKEASHPSLKSFEISTLSPAEFEEYKKAKIYPQIFEQCMREGNERYGRNGKVPTRISAGCDCYSRAVLSVMTQKVFSDSVPQNDMDERVKAAYTGMCSSLR